MASDARRLSNHLLVCFPINTLHQNPTRFISGHPSRENCLVINVDGSCSGHSGHAGAGGLIRRGDGSWVVGFSSYLGLSNNIMAIYQGLRLARNFRCTYIICYSDSKGVIDILAKHVNKYCCYASAIANIVCFIYELGLRGKVMSLSWGRKC